MTANANIFKLPGTEPAEHAPLPRDPVRDPEPGNPAPESIARRYPGRLLRSEIKAPHRPNNGQAQQQN